MRLSFRLWIVVICGVSMCMAPPARAEWGFPSEFLDGSYLSTVSQEMLDAAPSWDAKDENPPISAKKAIAAAERVLQESLSVKKFPDWRVVLNEVALSKMEEDKWIWIVRYEARPRAGTTQGIPSFADIVVMMDGKAIVPQRQSKPK